MCVMCRGGSWQGEYFFARTRELSARGKITGKKLHDESSAEAFATRKTSST